MPQISTEERKSCLVFRGIPEDERIRPRKWIENWTAAKSFDTKYTQEPNSKRLHKRRKGVTAQRGARFNSFTDWITDCLQPNLCKAEENESTVRIKHSDDDDDVTTTQLNSEPNIPNYILPKTIVVNQRRSQYSPEGELANLGIFADSIFSRLHDEDCEKRFPDSSQRPSEDVHSPVVSSNTAAESGHPEEELLTPYLFVEIDDNLAFERVNDYLVWLDVNVSLSMIVAFVFPPLAKTYRKLMRENYPHEIVSLFRETIDISSPLRPKIKNPNDIHICRKSRTFQKCRHEILLDAKGGNTMCTYGPKKALKLNSLMRGLVLLYDRLEELIGRLWFLNLAEETKLREEFLRGDEMPILQSWKKLYEFHLKVAPIFPDNVTDQLEVFVATFKDLRETVSSSTTTTNFYTQVFEAQAIMNESGRLFCDDLIYHPFVTKEQNITHEPNSTKYSDIITLHIFKVNLAVRIHLFSRCLLEWVFSTL